MHLENANEKLPLMARTVPMGSRTVNDSLFSLARVKPIGICSPASAVNMLDAAKLTDETARFTSMIAS